MRLRAVPAVLFLVVLGSGFAIPARADSIPTDTFVVDFPAIGNDWQATFTMPATIPGGPDGATYNVVATVTNGVTTETLNYNLGFNSIAVSVQNFYMNCSSFNDPADFCFERHILSFFTDPFSYANGEITFIPGVYGPGNGDTLTIIDPPAPPDPPRAPHGPAAPVPEPGALVLLTLGIAALGLIASRREKKSAALAMRTMRLRALPALLLLASGLASSTRADSIPTDTFVLNAMFQITFTMPASIPGGPDGAQFVLGPATATYFDGEQETLDWTLLFTSVAAAPDGENFVMTCSAPAGADPGDFCFLSIRNLLSFETDPFTYADGEITFIPGVYSTWNGNNLTIIADAAEVPEPGTLALLVAGLAGLLGLIVSRRGRTAASAA